MKKGVFYFITTLLCLCLFFSCENEDSIIGENLLIHNQHDVFVLNDSLIGQGGGGWWTHSQTCK